MTPLIPASPASWTPSPLLSSQTRSPTEPVPPEVGMSAPRPRPRPRRWFTDRSDLVPRRTRRPVLRDGNGGWSGWIDEFGAIETSVTLHHDAARVRGLLAEAGAKLVLSDVDAERARAEGVDGPRMPVRGVSS